MKFQIETLRAAALLTVCWAALAGAGCTESTSQPTSPVVTADSEEGKRAMAEDEAERALRKQQEARARARKKNLNIPEEG